jgi:CRISPR type IV-associated protein Csf3
MYKNWAVVCNLLTPLVDSPPRLDSLLGYQVSLNLDYKYKKKLTKKTPLSDIETPELPIDQKNIGGYKIYKCSDPILGPTMAEWTAHQAKRFDSSLMALKIDEKKRKNLLVASGPHKMRYVPVRLRLIQKIVWLVKGEKKELEGLLRQVWALGKYRHYGYGRIGSWEYKEQDKDNSIIAETENKKILMRRVPLCMDLSSVEGWRKFYGGVQMPYWHPETFTEVAEPC